MPGTGFGALGPKKCVWVSSDPEWRAACMVQSTKSDKPTATRRETRENRGIRRSTKTETAEAANSHEAYIMRSDDERWEATTSTTDCAT